MSLIDRDRAAIFFFVKSSIALTDQDLAAGLGDFTLMGDDSALFGMPRPPLMTAAGISRV
jgi:hypothetical protein